jgi:uncharacterized protein
MPKKHSFHYRVFMFCIDLQDLPRLGKSIKGFSHNRLNLYSIYDQDHVSLGQLGGIRGNLIHWLESKGHPCPNDVHIQLITFPRVLGYGFNPVSFYYISTNDGEPLLSVAEVTNTFREMKLYIVDSRDDAGNWNRMIPKNFYVSPFSDPGDDFDFKLGKPESEWRVNIDDYSKGEKRLMSSVRGQKRALSASRLAWYAFKYPLLSLKIIALIHWHAFRLWFKKVPHFRKSDRQEVQREVMRPHSILKKN